MPKYLFEASYTQSGIQGVLDSGGTSREKVVREAIEKLGGKTEAFYFAFGTTDAFVIADLPDHETAAALGLTVGASGGATVSTTVLLTPAQIDAARTRDSGYRPPGR